MSQSVGQPSAFANRLRQLRIERGLSLRRLAALALSSKSHIHQFETGQSFPRPTTVDLIDRALRANGELVALATAAQSVEPSGSGHDDRLRRMLYSFLVTPGQHLSGPLLAGIDSIRHSVDRTLAAAATVTVEQVESRSEAADASARECVVVPPPEMLCRLTLSMADAQRYLWASQPSPALSRDLHLVVARLATLIADEMTVLGDVQQSRAWYHTARTAADRTNDNGLRADVRTLAALLPLYYGDAREVVKIVRQAQQIAANTPCLTTALAPTYESLAWAQMSAVEDSEAALAEARNGVAGLDGNYTEESVFGFSPRRWRFYEGKILSYLGRTEEAWAVHDDALALYPSEVVGDPALIHFDRSVSLIRGEQVEAGCVLAERTLLGLPDSHRTSIFVRAANRAFDAVPRSAWGIPAVKRYQAAIRSCVVVSA